MKDYPRAFAELPRILAHPRQSRETILAYQSRALRRLVRDAYDNVIYYRQLFDREKIKPDDIKSPADLGKIPITTKKDLRDRPLAEILRRGSNPSRLRSSRTTGSTGEPFSVWRSDGEEFILDLFRQRVLRGFGLKTRDVMVRVMFHPVDPTLPWRMARGLGIYRQHHIYVLKAPEIISEEIQKLKPDVLTGNVGVLAHIARVAAGSMKPRFNLKFVVVGSEFSTAGMRGRIADAFRAPAYNVYAARESGLIGWECRTTGRYHVHDDSLILEVLDGDKTVLEEGEGEAVLTALHSRNMPLIRFKLGDRVKKGPAPCPCGVPFSTLDSILGRMSDYLFLPDGRRLYARAADDIIREHAPWIAQYELEQESVASVVLRAIPLAANTPETDSLTKRILAVLGPDVDFRVEIVDTIKPGPRGKFAFLRSNVFSEFDRNADAGINSAS